MEYVTLWAKQLAQASGESPLTVITVSRIVSQKNKESTHAIY